MESPATIASDVKPHPPPPPSRSVNTGCDETSSILAARSKSKEGHPDQRSHTPEPPKVWDQTVGSHPDIGLHEMMISGSVDISRVDEVVGGSTQADHDCLTREEENVGGPSHGKNIY